MFSLLANLLPRGYGFEKRFLVTLEIGGEHLKLAYHLLNVDDDGSHFCRILRSSHVRNEKNHNVSL